MVPKLVSTLEIPEICQIRCVFSIIYRFLKSVTLSETKFRKPILSVANDMNQS